MDAVFIDQNGNKKIFLYQYDKGQYLEIENFPYAIAPKIYFQIKTIATSIPVQSTLQNNTLKCLIPNSLLAYGEDILAYIYIEDGDKGYVTETIFISVIPRKRPSNYSEIPFVNGKIAIGFLPDEIFHNVVLTDASRPDKKYTLGVDNGKLQLILIETDLPGNIE